MAGGGLCLLAGEARLAIKVGHDHRLHAGPGAGRFLHLVVIAQGDKQGAGLFIISSLQCAAGLSIEVGDAGGVGRIVHGSCAGCGAGRGRGDFHCGRHGFVRGFGRVVCPPPSESRQRGEGDHAAEAKEQVEIVASGGMAALGAGRNAPQ